MQRTAPYGTWKSPVDIRQIFEKSPSPAYPAWYRGALYWLEARPGEGGRQVLMRRDADGAETCLTPADYNVRTRVHEYGGRCFTLANGKVYFCNYQDQRIYAQDLRGEARPVALTPADFGDDSLGMYADLQLTADGRYLVFVWERGHRGRENGNVLGVLDVNGRRDPVVLVDGCDFYANPAVTPNGRRLAWVQWRHPRMPWDESELWMGTLAHRDEEPELTDARRIAGGSGQSVCQAAFAADGTLYFVRDGGAGVEGEYWNLYQYRDGVTSAVTADAAEYGYPHWVFGETRHVPLNHGEVIASRLSGSGDELVLIDAHGATRRLGPQFHGFTQLSRADDGDDVVMVARATTRAAAILKFSAADRRLQSLKPADTLLTEDDISIAQPINYPTRDGGTAYAYFYPPKNSHFQGPADARPPLLVMVHGGPTSRCVHTLDVAKQYWTTIGFAVLDVNHRGSTGHGRSYRQALLGHWGEYDVSDIIDGIEYLKQRELVDANKVCIRGRSAGGYTVLQALTMFPAHFNAGACYFGIGNLVTLAETTHKFELHYTDGLIGEVFEPHRARRRDSLYYQRSPIHHMDRLRSPMIVFQGLEDKVVPPALSRELVAALEERDIAHEYVEYSGEGHGFRGNNTNIDALTRETRFYIRILEL